MNTSLCLKLSQTWGRKRSYNMLQDLLRSLGVLSFQNQKLRYCYSGLKKKKQWKHKRHFPLFFATLWSLRRYKTAAKHSVLYFYMHPRSSTGSQSPSWAIILCLVFKYCIILLIPKLPSLENKVRSSRDRMVTGIYSNSFIWKRGKCLGALLPNAILYCLYSSLILWTESTYVRGSKIPANEHWSLR